MVCMVKLKKPERLVPSCGMKAEEGMQVESETAEVHDVRRAALELLLSDHIGDCVAPCQRICQAHMNIPLMIRQIAAGNLQDAIATAKEHIALPAILGRICPAPCEKGCRRGLHDAPVSICLLKRFAADADLSSPSAFLPPVKPATGRKVAVIGAGPAGLSAAYYLLREGIIPTVFDEHEKPGGALQYAIPENELPRDVVDAEAGVIRKMGAVFQMNTAIGKEVSFDELRNTFAAVLIAAGEHGEGKLGIPGLDVSERGVKVDKFTYQTNLPGVFAAGNAVLPGKMAVRSVADGRDAALSISRYLAGLPMTVPEKQVTSRIDKLLDGEMEVFLAGASTAKQTAPSGGATSGLSATEAREEAHRCLHCDCRKADTCKLRGYAQEYNAKPRLFYFRTPKGDESRKMFEQYQDGSRVIYEPGKCISCGLCVQITAKASEALGLTFVGRSFDVRVEVPFKRPMDEGLKKVAAECVAACPTGALALKQEL
jgi:NADPH-dependent glutamate synthase beta subunit-like oxidoreductase/ferredoxin